MGRKKVVQEKKKDRLSITISKTNYNYFEEFGISNKSKLIEWLLKEHFELNKKGV